MPHLGTFPPATRWKYSNLAYTIAGMLVEELSGLTWAEYLRRHIFEPLDMGASSVDQNVPALAVGYRGARNRGTFG